MIYKDIKTKEISFPLGGIGAGCIGLAGNGRLIDWEIFNRPNKGSLNGMSHFAVRAEKNGKVIDARILQGDLLPPYSGQFGQPRTDGFGWGPSRNNLCGLPHFSEHTFKGEFPIAEIMLSAESFPGAITLEAFSPFIPGNDFDSSLPAACFEVEITNTSHDIIDYTVIGALGNPYDSESAWNRYELNKGKHHLTVSHGGDANELEYGDLTLATSEGKVSYQEYWFRGGWCDDLEVYWNDLMQPGEFSNRTYPCRTEKVRKKDTGLLAVHFSLNPGESHRAVFVLTWNVPNRKNDWRGDADEMAEKNGVVNRWKNWYATQWLDSGASSSYVLDNYARLKDETWRFHYSLFASTLPPAAMDAVSANMAVLRSPTCLRLEDGTFYGWEGVGVDAGSCEGSCTHVWNYAQVLPFLFPALERSMRTANYRFSVDEDGGSHFRIMLPLEIKADIGFMRPCVDGQFGDIMKTYRDWKISGDTAWLKSLWPALRRTLQFAWNDKNYDCWDPERSGVITGRQHHTLDMELFGPNAWLNGHYLGALKAVAEMAEALEEAEFATECREIFCRGKAWTDKHLFNGEYYFQQIDLNDQSLLEPFVRNDTDRAVDIYWNVEHGEIKYQIGEGCEIDMHLPQWYASLYGLGEVLEPDQVKSTLEAVFRYNFKPSMRNEANTWRNYCINDEAGVQICAWPEGRRKPVIPLPYASETMHGFEYAAACHMIMNGMLEEGMEIVGAIRNRYDGEKRNPWNEIECGSNYARSMASYALLNAFSGFRFDLTRGMIGFFPLSKDKKFRCFWSLGSVWGEFIRSRGTDNIKIVHGTVRLRELLLEAGINSVEINGKSLAFEYKEDLLIFPETINLNSGDELLLHRIDMRAPGSSQKSVPTYRNYLLYAKL